MNTSRLPSSTVAAFLIILNYSRYLGLLAWKITARNNYSHDKLDVAVLNKPTFLLGYNNGGMIVLSYFVASNQETLCDRGNIKNMPQQQSDSSRWSTLMLRAHAGSESDYQQLLSELAIVIHAYLRKRLGNQYFIEDCVQETLLAIHRARHTYDPKRPFRPWFFTIVRHKMIDFLRHRITNRRNIEHHQQEQYIHNQGTQPSIQEDSIDSDSLLSALPTKYKDVLTLTKLLGFTCAEAAKQLGISESAVKVRVHRAINKLRKTIEAED